MASSLDLILTRKQLDILFASSVIKQQAVIAFDNLFRKSIPTEYYCYQVVDYVLTSTTALQKVFNTSPSGAISLNAGEYLFEWLHFFDNMAAAVDNAQLSLIGAGTAVLAGTERFFSEASDIAVNTINIPSYSHNSGVAVTPNPIATPNAATSLVSYMRGAFTVTTAGTIIPSIALTSAAAAKSAKGSFFKVTTVNLSNLVGPWS